MNLIDRITREMETDTEDMDDQSERLEAVYRTADEAGKTWLDTAFICLCGWKLQTLIERGSTGDDGDEVPSAADDGPLRLTGGMREIPIETPGALPEPTRYVVEFGNSTVGIIGGVLRVTATSPADALEQAQTNLPERLSEPFAGTHGGMDLGVYLNTEALTLANVRKEDDQ